MAHPITEALGLGDQGVASLVGGGGKTTLMFRLANELVDMGRCVLTTTTTKLFRPEPSQSMHVVAGDEPDRLRRRLDTLLASGCRHITAVKGYGGGPDKLVGLATDDLTRVIRPGGFDWVLVEADGAKRRPLKAPAEFEPVIAPETTLVVAVVGLEAVGRPMAAPWVFRCQHYARLTGLKPGAPVSAESVALVLTHPGGMTKGAPDSARRCVFLNKADTPRRLAVGRRLADLLLAAPGGPERVVVGALRDADAVRWIGQRPSDADA